MPSPPYDTLEAVLNAARVRLNDAIQTLGGEIITDSAVFTPQAVNNAWRRLQEYLVDRGFAALKSEIIFTNVPAWGSTDPGVFVWLNWANYFDGVGTWGAPLVLPQDMISPLDLEERLTGSNSAFRSLDQVFNGLPTENAGNGPTARDVLNRLWEWRGETIYMPGATSNTDIRLRYAKYLPDFVWTMPGPPNPSTLTVPIMRSLNSLAWYICSEMARPRGDMDAGQFDTFAMDAAEQIWNRDYREGKKLYKRAELGKMGDSRSRLQGANAPNAAGVLAQAGGNG